MEGSFIPVYNKLVRDLIPQIIEQAGKHASTEILNDDDYITELRSKLGEELQEYLEAENDQEFRRIGRYIRADPCFNKHAWSFC